MELRRKNDEEIFLGQRSYCDTHWYLSKVNVISTSIMSEVHMPIIKKGQNITTWDS